MEEKKNNLKFLTLVLTMIAGFCDTLTFFNADAIFSAHVTGNFVVFAYHLLAGSDPTVWLKLLTFPVFMFSVFVSGWIASRFISRYFLFYCEGLLLLLGATIAHAVGPLESSGIPWSSYLIVMIVVFAMGFQNAYGRLYAMDTYGPTTIMTGNVTQFALDFRIFLMTPRKDHQAYLGLKKGLVTLGGFLCGCTVGAIFGKYFGLISLFLPGFVMIACFFATVPKNIYMNVRSMV